MRKLFFLNRFFPFGSNVSFVSKQDFVFVLSHLCNIWRCTKCTVRSSLFLNLPRLCFWGALSVTALTPCVTAEFSHLFLNIFGAFYPDWAAFCKQEPRVSETCNSLRCRATLKKFFRIVLTHILWCCRLTSGTWMRRLAQILSMLESTCLNFICRSNGTYWKSLLSGNINNEFEQKAF